MAATDINKSTLLGSLSTMGLVADSDVNDTQEFAFSGLDGAFKTSLGFKGRVVVFEGLIRVSGANLAATRAAFQTQAETIRNYKRLGTLLDLFQDSDSSSIAGLYEDAMENVVVDGFQFTGPATSSSGGTIMSQPYRLIMRKLT